MNTNQDTPSSSSSLRLRRIRRLAWWVRLLSLFAAVGLLVGTALFWSRPGWLSSVAQDRWGLSEATINLDPRSRLLGWAFSWLPNLVMLFALWQIWALFGYYRRSEFFASGPALHLRRLGAALMAYTLAQPLGVTLSVLALTLGNPAGQRRLYFGLGTDQYLSLFLGLAILVIGIVMEEASRMAQENAEFI
ncbi:DUF2975 domain-containing protein [Paucibacter sp. Y2R2-4]|uniref:DUF2975 domain-containing protein n=1 Tax=Paucibacter sp. Y2R2-4 TaxID=2893553 RepID=UPI0021E4DAF3|nr:DUF2975 domain-containing protein [Paucibacter sp. Y2R2-4]MCV2349133.1 DUF2975 domain-containing protein [Paucibacter sp. Y2R2-4]